jgi:UDP-N-acetylmuramoyl-tripeptide--D-alanyl-D-alanine ligase
MIPMSAAEIAAVTGGRVLGDPDVTIDGTVHTDSRLVTPGDVFVALPGEVTDGHEFIDAAIAAGAALVIAERAAESAPPVPMVVVDDGVVALSDLAREVVARVRALGRLRVVAVTGSNGKTTTKNMLRAVLERQGETVAPRGSFNNEVGAPISMLGVTESTEFLVVEMGADAVGDITKLVSVVVPDVAIVLTVGLAHVGKFGSIEHTARAKGELVVDLPPTAIAVLNRDDPRVSAMPTAARVRWFGLGDAALHDDSTMLAANVVMTLDGTSFDVLRGDAVHPVHLRILGEHHAMNALATLSAATALGIDLDQAIDAIESMDRAERWRMELMRTPDGVTIINDAYNASPDSTAAALRTLASLTRGRARAIAVLGEMAELGEFSGEEHDRIGLQVVRLNIDQLVVVGAGARRLHLAATAEGSWDGESIFAADPEAAYDVIRDLLHPGDVVLVKSSNSSGLRHLGDRLAGIAS